MFSSFFSFIQKSKRRFIIHTLFILRSYLHFLLSNFLRVFFSHTVVWYQLFPSNTNNLHTVIGYQVFPSNKNNLHTVIWYQVFPCNTKNLHTLIWYQVFPSNTNNLHLIIWYQVFLSNTSNLYTVVRFNLVSLPNGMSTFVGLMPKSSL